MGEAVYILIFLSAAFVGVIALACLLDCFHD